MANTKSAKKALRVSERRRKVNKQISSGYRTIKTSINKALVDKDIEKAQKLMGEFQSAIDKAIKKKFIKKNTGARYKSRVSSAIKKAKDSK